MECFRKRCDLLVDLLGRAGRGDEPVWTKYYNPIWLGPKPLFEFAFGISNDHGARISRLLMTELRLRHNRNDPAIKAIKDCP